MSLCRTAQRNMKSFTYLRNHSAQLHGNICHHLLTGPVTGGNTQYEREQKTQYCRNITNVQTSMNLLPGDTVNQSEGPHEQTQQCRASADK